MEYFDIYNDKWEKTGRTAARETRLQKGDYLLAADICLVNSEDCFLLQKRTANKTYCPNMWGLTGGSVLAGESSREAIYRETWEEICIKLEMSTVDKIYSYKSEGEALVDLWLGRLDCEVSQMKRQEEEVAELRWVSAAEVRKIIAEGQFMCGLVPGIEKCLEILGL